MLKYLYKTCLITLILLSCFSFARSQQSSTTGAIIGNVKDAQGSVVGGVAVAIQETETNITRNAVTNEDGSYSFLSLRPGNYKIIFEKDGFSNIEQTITISLGLTSVGNIVLPVVNSTYIVEVSSENSQITKTENSTNINRNQIENLPINQRGFLNFAFTSARIVPDRLPTNAVSVTSGLSVNGQSARFNNLTIDGLANNDYVLGASRSTFSQDSVQEFQVVSDSYSAEFGRALGGIVNIVTRSGSNFFHGRLFLLNRNATISAKEPFSSVKPDTKQYQFGAILSGPIKKDKAFFFSSFERSTSKLSRIVTISQQTIFSARMFGGSISNGPIPYSLATTTALVKADFLLGNRNTLTLRYNGGGSYNSDSNNFGGLIASSTTGIQRLKDNSFVIANKYTGNTLVNETRLFYVQGNQNILPVDTNPRVRLFADEGIVDFGNEANLPLTRREDTYQLVNNSSFSYGNHNIKLGLDLSYTKLSSATFSNLRNGVYAFSNLDFRAILGLVGAPSSFVFNPLQALDPTLRTPEQIRFLTRLSTILPLIVPFPKNIQTEILPLPALYAQTFGSGIPNSGSLRSLSFFVQDDFKVKSNLILKSGLRYDLNRTDFGVTNNGNFSPRLAISYNPNNFKGLHIKASYGLFFTVPLLQNIFRAKIDKTATTLVLLFPFSLLPLSQPSKSFPDSNLPPTNFTIMPQLSQQIVLSKQLRNSYSQQASVGLDYSFDNKTSLSLTYNLVKGIKLFASRNINPITFPIFGDSFTNASLGRPDPTKGDIQELESAFDSSYHAFTISFDKQFDEKFTLLAHYTFSKSIDNVVDIFPEFQELRDPLQPGQEKALSLQDLRSRLVISGTWNINYKKNPILNNFKVSTIASFNSGRPYNLLAGTDLDSNGIDSDRPIVNGVQIGRNLGITPGFANIDLRISRTVSINKKIKLELLGEAFNLFNRVNINPNQINRVFLPNQQAMFNLPKKQGRTFSLPENRFNGAFAPRQFQIGAKISF